MQNFQTEKNCSHQMQQRGRLGYAYIPMQQGIGKVYSPQKALCVGTIFPELNITMGEYERGLYNGK